MKAKNKATTYGEIIACTPILCMLLQLYELKDYYAFTKMFQPYSLARHVVGVHGAVRVLLFVIIFISKFIMAAHRLCGDQLLEYPEALHVDF